MVTLGLTQLRRGRDDAWLQVLIMIPKYRWLLLLLKTISAIRTATNDSMDGDRDATRVVRQPNVDVLQHAANSKPVAARCYA